ncbi:hypothetical protein [Saccharopolyspora karakumensis]|uniref:hypothetical protein n=1 Tax=Saccharopolyspora karakumensis TaxID=2530386 RepID=UPI001A9F0B5A|nr:hypothetical protein [Saccharopolyspora karakumensis]
MATDDDRKTGPAWAGDPEIPVVTGDAGIDYLMSAAGRHLDATATVTSVDPSEVIDRIFHGGSAHEPELAAPAVGRTALHDASATPTSGPTDTDAAGHATARSRRRPRRPGRTYLVPLSAAAAVLVLMSTGVSVAARDAQPGDILWGVAQILYADHTKAVVSAGFVREDLNTAESAIENGNRNAAEEALRSAKEQLQGVDAEHGLSELRAAHASLTARIDHDERSPSTPNSPAPPTILHPPQGTGA